MNLLKLIAPALLFVSLTANASPIAGKWQGPCETREGHSVKFTYVITPLNQAGVGKINKTKIYYRDLACAVYNRTGRAPVDYVLGQPSEDGIYPINLGTSSNTFYDIVKLDQNDQLIFGDYFSRSAAERPTVLSTTDRVFTRVAE